MDVTGATVRSMMSLAALALGVGLNQIAAAAVTAAPVAAITNNWSGVYVGAHVGGAWQSAPDWTYFNPNNGATFSLTQSGNLGAAGGLQGGYNWQLAPSWLFGIEGDISWTSLGQTRAVPTIGPRSFAPMSPTNQWPPTMPAGGPAGEEGQKNRTDHQPQARESPRPGRADLADIARRRGDRMRRREFIALFGGAARAIERNKRSVPCLWDSRFCYFARNRPRI